MLAAMAIGAGVGALGSLANTGLSFGLNQYSSKKAAKKAYQYWRQSQLEGPSLQRQGLEKAGYNPMLALSQGAASFNQGVSAPQVNAGDFVGSARQGAELAKEAVKSAKAQIANIEADTALKQGQLDAVETQRLQTEANTSLLQSQAERSDLAYGIDIANALTGIAGTGAQLYSAKAMADVAKQNALSNYENALTNRENAKTNRQNADRLSAGSERVITNTDKNGKPVSETIVSDNPNTHSRARSNGVPEFSNSAKGATPNPAGGLGASAKTAGSIVKQVAKELLFLAPAAVGAYGVGKLQESAERRIKSDSRSNYGKGYKHFVPRLGL